jgi:hypothetical protein
MKTLILILASLVGSSQSIDWQTHRHLQEDNEAQQNLFAMEQKDMVQTKYTISPVSFASLA